MKSMRECPLIPVWRKRQTDSCEGESLAMLSPLGNERGIAIVVALLVLMLLSVLAITFSDTTIMEKAIVRSEAVFERVFFKAESGAMEGIQKLANESSPNELLPARGGAVNNAGLLVSVSRDKKEDNIAMVDANNDSKFTVLDVPSWNLSPTDTKIYRRVVLAEGGGVTGHESSLKATEPRDYYYTAFGYSDVDNGSAMIKIGYVKHF